MIHGIKQTFLNCLMLPDKSTHLCSCKTLVCLHSHLCLSILLAEIVLQIIVEDDTESLTGIAILYEHQSFANAQHPIPYMIVYQSGIPWVGRLALGVLNFSHLIP